MAEIFLFLFLVCIIIQNCHAEIECDHDAQQCIGQATQMLHLKLLQFPSPDKLDEICRQYDDVVDCFSRAADMSYGCNNQTITEANPLMASFKFMCDTHGEEFRNVSTCTANQPGTFARGSPIVEYKQGPELLGNEEGYMVNFEHKNALAKYTTHVCKTIQRRRKKEDRYRAKLVENCGSILPSIGTIYDDLMDLFLASLLTVVKFGQLNVHQNSAQNYGVGVAYETWKSNYDEFEVFINECANITTVE